MKDINMKSANEILTDYIIAANNISREKYGKYVHLEYSDMVKLFQGFVDSNELQLELENYLDYKLKMLQK